MIELSHSEYMLFLKRRKHFKEGCHSLHSTEVHTQGVRLSSSWFQRVRLSLPHFQVRLPSPRSSNTGGPPWALVRCCHLSGPGGQRSRKEEYYRGLTCTVVCPARFCTCFGSMTPFFFLTYPFLNGTSIHLSHNHIFWKQTTWMVSQIDPQLEKDCFFFLFCLKMNHTSNLTCTWFGWSLDEI